MNSNLKSCYLGINYSLGLDTDGKFEFEVLRYIWNFQFYASDTNKRDIRAFSNKLKVSLNLVLIMAFALI
jgi:hypothetical protein